MRASILRPLNIVEPVPVVERERECIDYKWYPRVIVLGPGGAKGLKMLGFLSPLEDAGLLDYVDTYCGVSVGAIISLLIVCGYQIREIVGEAAKLDMFKDFNSIDIKSIIDNVGLMSNEPIKRQISQLVIDKFGNIPTLYSLYMRTGKAFICVSLNATDEECVIMGPFTHPDISCVDATMFSMNIPFIFYQIIYNGKTYVDGILANPYPIDYFDNGETNILGIYLKNDVSQPTSLSAYLQKIVHSLTNMMRTNIIQAASTCCKHVRLKTKNVDVMGYGVSIQDKALMLVEGFNEGKDFLDHIGDEAVPHVREKLRYTYPPYYYGDDDDEEGHNDAGQGET
jgi:predicted acylesterase/phospholipase RssA